MNIPTRTDFPKDCKFYIKEFNVRPVHMPNGGRVNWYGGRPREYDSAFLMVDNNWLAESFEEWTALVAESL